MNKQNINWEERRFIASAIILAGICSNYQNPIPTSYRAEDAVKLADSLIQILSDSPRPSLCSDLYHQSSELSK